MKWLSCIIAIALLFPVISIARPPGGATPSVKTSTGYKGAVGNTRDDLERYQRLAEKGRKTDLTTMVADQRIFLLTTPTRVKVLDKNLEVSKVRVLEGKHRNKSGWVLSASIEAGAQKPVRTSRASRQRKKEIESVPEMIK